MPTSALFERVLESNNAFWKKTNCTSASASLLYESFYAEKPLIYGVSKVALCIAKAHKLNPLCIKSLTIRQDNNAFVESMNANCWGSKKDYFLSFFKNAMRVVRLWIRVGNGADLLKLKYEKYELGIYIYDFILRTLALPTLHKLSVKIRIKIMLELFYFFAFKDLIAKHNIKVIVLGDNVYRYGLLFEIAKRDMIPCYCPINLNAFSLRKFDNEEDYCCHDRKPSKELLDSLDCEKVNARLDAYFKQRFSANLEQHDVLKAFSGDKVVFSREALVVEYNLKSEAPIVVVMAHIFADAPHGYPGTLYDDYTQWFKESVRALQRNDAVNFLVKEHPSAALYNEKGIVRGLLKELGAEDALFRDNVHSLTVLNNCDVVVTCGGTIGQEFAYKKKAVVLAAAPPYSGFGFTIEPATRAEYEALLRNGVESLPPMSDEAHMMAKKVAYHDFMLLQNYDDSLEIGGERFCMGKDFDEDRFHENICAYNNIPLKKQNVYSLLEPFCLSDKKHLLREEDGK